MKNLLEQFPIKWIDDENSQTSIGYSGSVIIGTIRLRANDWRACSFWRIARNSRLIDDETVCTYSAVAKQWVENVYYGTLFSMQSI